MPRGFVGGGPAAPHLYNQIQGSLWTELSRRLFGGARTPSVAPEIGIQVDMFSRPELWALHGGSLVIGLVDGVAAGGAGFRSQCSLSMITATRSICILENLIVSSGAVEVLYLYLSQTELTSSTGNLVTRDTRRVTTTGGSAPATARIWTKNNAALSGTATTISRIFCAGNDTHIIPLDLVIGPGWSVRVTAATDNTAIVSALTFVARERVCTPDELAIL